MKAYRRVAPIKAMTFDLDDTLYDNHPVIRKVEQQAALWLHKQHPVSATKPLEWWQAVKRDIALQQPEIKHDVTSWRFYQIKQGLMALNYSERDAQQAAMDLIAVVLEWRSDFDVPEETHSVMSELAKRFPLVAITNGNVDVDKIGLSSYFELVLKAGPDGRAKPYPDMFNAAQNHLGIDAISILHVGDHLITDVQGAKQNGFQACWFNDKDHSLISHPKARALPDIEITKLNQLLIL